jgi:hypothetical protein
MLLLLPAKFTPGLYFGDENRGAPKDQTFMLKALPSPATLQRLDIELNVRWGFCVNLGHLTALTHLTVDHSFHNFMVPDYFVYDRLPPNLVSLCCDGFSAEVARECKSLRHVNDHAEQELAELLRVSEPTKQLK